jgi:hypothetical protein
MKHGSKNGTGKINLPAIKTIDAHSVLNRKSPKSAKACDAADVVDGHAALQNPTIRLVAAAFGVSVGYVLAARRLTPTQREAVRNGWRPLILPRSTPALPAPVSPQERLAGIVAELGVTGTLNALASIERAAA